MNNEIKEKPLVIYSILKWYGVAIMTLATAITFVYWVNGDGDYFLVFLLNLPLAVYLWSLVSRKIT